MHPIHRPVSRALAAGALSLALLSAGSAGAFAAEAKPSPAPSSPSPKPSPSMSTMGSITVKASKTSVKSGDTVTFIGRTHDLKIGSPLVLQHENNGKWTSLKASVKVKNGNAYSLTAKLNTKGTQHLRIAAVGKKVYSPTVTVKVN
ncbi:hypothetical protein ABTY98_01485 [Streptomyces sp. NPDC096040]|uniref:hypothetical protein n=1 Tax=Streptomyces sp. NPDC096040 TaxID=3155541 RepID=UPI00332645D3